MSRDVLISEPIAVEQERGPGGILRPAAFVWRGRRYGIVEIVRLRFDSGFAPGELTRTWWRRRHRNHYVVRADDGVLYELYLDRGGSRRRWFLLKKLDG